MGVAADAPAAQPAQMAESVLAGESRADEGASVEVLQEAVRRDVAQPVQALAYSPSQQLLFAATPGDEHGGTASWVRLLNPSTLDDVDRIRLPLQGMGMTLDDAGNRLYVTHAHDGAISIIDTKTRRRLRTIRVAKKLDKPVGPMRYAHMLRQVVVDPESGRAFAPGLGLHGTDSVLFVIDIHTGRLEKTVPGFGFQATGIALDSRYGRVFVSNMQGQVMVVDVNTLKLQHTWKVEADRLLNLAYDGTRNVLLGVDQGVDRKAWREEHLGRSHDHRDQGNALVFLDATNGHLISQQETGEVPTSLVLDEKHNQVIVSSLGNIAVDKGEGSLAVFDLDSHRRLQFLPLPPHPDSLALDAAGSRVFVSLKNDKVRSGAGKSEQVVGLRLLRP